MAIKKVTIHAGHNPSGKIACGASDYLDESTEARIIVKKVVALLKKKKINVTNTTVNNGTDQKDVLRKICAKCDKIADADLNISIHFNACTHSTTDGKTKGVEVHVLNTNGVRGTVGKKICSNISKLGFANRGVKINTGLYFLNQTKRPSLLVEVCFVDDQDDAKLYKKNKDKIAQAIADAIASC